MLVPKFNAFSGSSRCLDGKPPTESNAAASSLLKHHQPEAKNNNVPSPSNSSRKHCGKLAFGSKGDQPSHVTTKVWKSHF